ncbi:hypothetical protein [Nocardioides cynanchi]|uniref:hypothetical protein n=1 Tax=Nocardioides cynanchi TaxID=2558918 RepID=UPI001243B5AA|nr:hypothetical protein [Nocardioides cynanchi]
MGMQRTPARARLAGLTAVAALALSACGSASSTTATDPGAGSGTPTAPVTHSPSLDVAPASGPVLSAGRFSFHAPQGWADVTDRAETGVVLSAANPTDDNPLMIIVRHRAQAPGSVTAAAKAAARLLAAAGGTDIRTRPATNVGGNRAAHVVATQTKPGSHYQLDAYYVLTGKDAWVITFATNQYTTPSHRDAMLASVLATCHWAGA